MPTFILETKPKTKFYFVLIHPFTEFSKKSLILMKSYVLV